MEADKRDSECCQRQGQAGKGEPPGDLSVRIEPVPLDPLDLEPVIATPTALALPVLEAACRGLEDNPVMTAEEAFEIHFGTSSVTT
jgi:hypothetical protein